MTNEEYAEDYELPHLLVTATAEEIKDGEIIFLGVGPPLLAGQLAKFTHAPNCIFFTENGTVDPAPRRLMHCVACTVCNENAYTGGRMVETMGDQQRGRVGIGIISGAQIDIHGNVNSTCIGDYENPKVRMAGSGGANDIASSAQRTVIMIRSTERSFVEEVDYITSPGHLDGPGARKEAGLKGNGPAAVISAEGVFRFRDDTKEMYLESYHPGQSVEEIQEMVPWELDVADDVHETEHPTKTQMNIIRTLDPGDIYVGAGREEYAGNFEPWLQNMLDSWEPIDKLMKEQEVEGM